MVGTPRDTPASNTPSFRYTPTYRLAAWPRSTNRPWRTLSGRKSRRRLREHGNQPHKSPLPRRDPQVAPQARSI